MAISAFRNLIRHGKHGRSSNTNNANPSSNSNATTNLNTTSSNSNSSNSNTSSDRTPHSSPAASSKQQQQQQQPAEPHPSAQAQQNVAPSHRDPAADMLAQAHHARGGAAGAGGASKRGGENYAKEAEMIVEEEKREKSKLPRYEGLERFRLVEKMGDGAFSNVYKAIDTQTGQKVAVKVVRKYELSHNQHLNPNFKKRPRVTERANILKEVQIMRGITHPAIVQLISFSESKEYYYLVLELMEGGELFHQIVKLTYFSENLARHVILQVAEGIRYLHQERGVVHRDIKPENLLFERIPIIPSKNPIHRPYDDEKEDEGEFIPGVGGGGIGRVKIADFGLSKVVWNEETMTPCGTVGYTAPEIVKDERYSHSVDMWALGCVLYTLLCGFPPFYDESISVLTEKVARGHYTFLSPWWDDISASAKDLITHLLCVDPAQRYTIEEFLNHPWCKEQPAKPQPSPEHVKPQQQHPLASAPLDSPMLQGMRGRAMPSPGVAQLKEAFDVTYAVHRAEEEGARRRGGAGKTGFLQNLNEGDEDEEDEEQLVEAGRKHGAGARGAIEDHRRAAAINAAKQQQAAVPDASSSKKQPVQQQQYQGWGGADRRLAEAELYGGRAGPRDRGHGRKPFELDIGNATLLGRRQKVVPPAGGAAGGSPLKAEQNVQDPGSPMRIG